MPHPQLANPASPEHYPSLKFLKVEFSLQTTERGLFLVSLFLESPLFSSTTQAPAIGCKFTWYLTRGVERRLGDQSMKYHPAARDQTANWFSPS